MGKANCDHLTVEVRGRIAVAPQVQAAPVVAGRTVNLRVMVGMDLNGGSLQGIMAILTSDVLPAMGIVTCQASPAGMSLISAHFLNYLKAVLPLMAVGA